MNTLRLYAGATGALVARDAHLYFSYRLRVVTQTGAALFSLALFYFISRMVRPEAMGSPDEYYAFVVVGLVILGVITSSLGTASQAVRQELVAGTFERLLVSPFGPVNSVLAIMIFPFFNAIINGALMLTIGVIVFGLGLEWSTLALAIPVAIASGLAFAPFGILIAAAVLAFKAFGQAQSFIIAGLSLVAGIYFPVALLPDWIQWFSEVQPFTPAVDLMRLVISGSSPRPAGWVELAKLLGFAAVLIPVSVVGLRAAIDVGRRRGTIIEF